jgi:shikimate kinase
MLIFLVGMMGSGKSTIGQKLAAELTLPYFDTDEIIASIEGMAVSDIFQQKGEAYFREAEKSVISHWKISDGVVATGGGLPCYNSLMDILNNKGKTVFLRTSIDTLIERISKDQSRPLVAGKSKTEIKKTVADLLKQRKPIYGQAKIKVNSEDSLEEVVRRIIIKLYSK